MGLPLVIGEEDHVRARAIQEYAAAHIISTEELKSAVETGAGYKYGDDPNFSMELPVGFKVVYTQELQNLPLGKCHHLSVSVGRPNRAPNEHAMTLIAELFGIKDLLGSESKTVIFKEDLGEGYTAINALVPFVPPVVDGSKQA